MLSPGNREFALRAALLIFFVGAILHIAAISFALTLKISSTTEELLRHSAMSWAAGGLFFAALIMFFFNRRFYRPMAVLNVEFARASRESFKAEVKVRRKGKLSWLDKHFNEMAEVLNGSAQNDESRSENMTEMFGRILEESANEIYIIEAERLMFVWANRGARENLGYEAKEIERLRATDVFTEYDEAGLKKIVRELREEEKAKTVLRMKQTRKDGSRFAAEVSLELSAKEGAIVAIAHDITERLQAEEELRKRQSHLETAQARAKLGSWEYHPETRTAEWSKEMFRLYYRNPEEGAPTWEEFLELVHPGDRQLVQAAQVKVFESFDPIFFDYRTNPACGPIRHLNATVHSIRDDEGRPAHISGTVLDITERKRAEEALRVSERKYKDIFKFAPVGIYQSSPDGTILTANYALAQMLGFSSVDELLHANLARDMYLNEGERRKLIGEYEPTGYAADVELQWKKKDGTPIWVSLNAHAIKDEKGETQYFEGFIRDITERKIAGQELRASEERFSKAFHASPIDMAIIRLRDMRYLDMNESALSGTGYAREEVVGRTMNEFNMLANPEDLGSLLRAIEENGAIRNVEAKSRRKCGAERVNLVSAEIIELGGERCLLAAVNDITEHKLAEQKLRASEERFSKAFDASPHSMVIATLDEGRYLDVNRSYLRITGYTREEVIGRTSKELDIWVNRQDRDRVVEMLNEQGRVRDVEARFHRKSGEEFIALFSAEIITLDGKKCLLTASNDITDRKRAEEEQARLQDAIRESAREWRLTFDAVESPLFIVDLNGNIIRLNFAARQIAGISYEEIVGQPLLSIGSGQPWQMAAHLVNRIRQTRSRVSSFVKDEMDGKSWEITASLFDTPDADRRIIIAARDITQTVRLQESLRRSETMSAMGALVAGVAHEVRNPLFSISATLDAFEARFGAREEYNRHISVLRGEADRLNQLMRELLEYGRPPRLELEKDSIEATVAQAVELCHSLAERSKVRLENRVRAGLAEVMMDRKRMGQVFQNLIENAIQHSGAGGEVTVEAGEERREGKVWMTCKVMDRGKGFDGDDLERIFEPFYTKRRGGTGLGLSIVQRIVEEHGGELRASNRPEGGATVEVRLPVCS